jgi:hypothetical protein
LTSAVPPPWQSTEEPKIRVEWTPTYRRHKQAISTDRARRALELAEEAIIVDPHHRWRRASRPDGIVVDLTEPGLLVKFRIEGDLLLFVDFEDLWND